MDETSELMSPLPELGEEVVEEVEDLEEVEEVEEDSAEGDEEETSNYQKLIRLPIKEPLQDLREPKRNSEK